MEWHQVYYYNVFSPEKHSIKDTAPITAPPIASNPNSSAEKEMMAEVMRNRTTNEHTPQTVRRKVNAMEMITVIEMNRMTESRPRVKLVPRAATWTRQGEAKERGQLHFHPSFSYGSKPQHAVRTSHVRHINHIRPVLESPSSKPDA